MNLAQAILLTIGIILILSILPMSLSKPLSLLVIIGSAIWIYTDSKNLKTENYNSFFALKPIWLLIGTLLLWIVFFPGYLQLRYKITHNLIKPKNQNPPQES